MLYVFLKRQINKVFKCSCETNIQKILLILML